MVKSPEELLMMTENAVICKVQVLASKYSADVSTLP